MCFSADCVCARFFLLLQLFQSLLNKQLERVAEVHLATLPTVRLDIAVMSQSLVIRQ